MLAVPFLQVVPWPRCVESAVLDDGWRTGDIAGKDIQSVKDAGKLVGTKKMGELVVEYLNK